MSALSLSHNLADIHLQYSSTPNKKNRLPPRSNVHTNIRERNEVKHQPLKTCIKAKPSTQQHFSRTGLDNGVLDHRKCAAGKKDNGLQTPLMEGGMGNNCGWICGGRGSDGRGWGWGSSEGNYNDGRGGMDAYYQHMIEANPADPLLLGNYAKYLKEVCGDYSKAEEYLERAILANPGDAHNLSLYADLIWQTEKNADRAERYFDQAIKSAPDDCYVMASYAKFLWDAEDDEEEDCCQNKSEHSHAYLSN